MTDSISWSVSAVASSGATCKASGVTPVDAIFSARVPVAAPTGTAAAVPLNLQLETASKFRFLAITCPNTQGEIHITSGTGTTATTVELDGPLILHGDAVKLFTGNLSTLRVKNTSSAATELSILIGYMLT